MEKERKRLNNSVKMQVVYLFVYMAVLAILYIFFVAWINYDKATNRMVTIDNMVVKEIETIEYKDKELKILGWILRNESKNSDVEVILRPTDGSRGYLLETSLTASENLNKYFSSDWDYGETKFEAKIKADKIVKNVCYEIIFAYSYDNGAGVVTEYISSSKYILNSKMYSYNPENFDAPVFNDIHIEQVVQNGELCAYDIDETFYLYRYGTKLYWIVGDKFKFNEGGKTYISYHAVTSRTEKLPENRQEYGFANFDFYFEDREYFLAEDLTYRVAIHEIPENFPVISYYTAVYNLDTQQVLWSTRFYPSYNIRE